LFSDTQFKAFTLRYNLRSRNRFWSSANIWRGGLFQLNRSNISIMKLRAKSSGLG